MSNIFYKLTLLFILFSLISCDNKENNIKSKVKFQLHSLVLHDSINIKGYGLNFQDYRNGNLLFYKRSIFDIIVYNLEKKKMYTFNKNGEGYGEYKPLTLGSTKFLNDSVIGVGGIKVIKKYNFEGKFINDIDVNIDSPYAPAINFNVFNDSLLMVHTMLQGNPTKPNFYKKNQTLYVIKNLNNGNQKKIIQFPLKDGDFKNDKYYYNNIYDFPYYVSKNKYCFVNSNGTNVYQYDINKSDITDIEEFNIPNFNPLKIEFGKKLSNNEKMMDLFIEGKIWNIFKSDSKTYILYSEGHTKDYMIEYVKSHKGFPFSETPKVNFFLYSFNDNEEVIVDLKDQYPVYVYPNNDVILSKKFHDEKNEKNDSTVIYFSKIEK